MHNRILLVVVIAFVAAGAARFALAAQEPQSSTWDGVFTEEQANRGGEFYSKECANCHGSELEGADMTPALSGGVFTSNWDSLTLGDLFERIRITMPADRPGSMPRQQIADVVAYMLMKNKFPAGKSELPREVTALKQIKFVATKPGAPSIALR